MTISALTTLLLVGLGGFVGSVLRYGAGEWIQKLSGDSVLPFGTLFVNVAGCLTIGILAGLSESRELLSEDARNFLFAGVLGGFTTFSAFGYQTLILLRDGHTSIAVANVGLQLALGLGAAAGGYLAARAV